jgi:anti-anti-sigma regulatory factor
MLRITRIATNASTFLKLEGKLLAPWTDEVLAEVARANGHAAIHLDLANVSFVDSAGLSLLRHLLARGVKLDSCSSFIAQLLHVEKP